MPASECIISEVAGRGTCATESGLCISLSRSESTAFSNWAPSRHLVGWCGWVCRQSRAAPPLWWVRLKQLAKQLISARAFSRAANNEHESSAVLVSIHASMRSLCGRATHYYWLQYHRIHMSAWDSIYVQLYKKKHFIGVIQWYLWFNMIYWLY